MKKNTYYQLGFSLSEMLVVVAIISIMSGIIILSLTTFMPFYRLRGDATQIVDFTRRAQNLALTEQEIYSINIDKNNRNYSIIKIIDETRTVIESVNLAKGNSFISDSVEIRFNAAGTPSASTTIIIVNSKNQQKSVNINQIGQVKIL